MIISLAALLGFLFYSVVQYRQSGIIEKGIVACEEEKCFWSAHIHIYIPVEICGEKYSLSRFEGPLATNHTHGEENVIHWHDRLKVDPVTKQFLEPNPFLLSRTLETLQIPLTEISILNKKDGDTCPDGSIGIWKVFINGIFSTDWRNHEWQDKDIVFFIFNARMVEEVEAELLEKPQVFPGLGAG